MNGNRHIPYPIQIKLHAIAMYEGGWSTYRVERLLGVPESTLRGWLKEAGIERRPRHQKGFSRIPAKEVNLCIMMYEAGYTAEEIGKAVRRHPMSIRKRLASWGVLRSKSEALKLSWKQGHRV